MRHWPIVDVQQSDCSGKSAAHLQIVDAPCAWLLSQLPEAVTVDSRRQLLHFCIGAVGFPSHSHVAHQIVQLHRKYMNTRVFFSQLNNLKVVAIVQQSYQALETHPGELSMKPFAHLRVIYR